MELVQAVFSSPLLFPKKTGADLKEASHLVARVYGRGYRGDPCAEASTRAADSSKVLHITCHPLKRDPLRLAVFAALALGWIVLYPLDVKVRSFLCALAYSFSESGFTLFERGRQYTSLGQFLGNLLYTPVLLDAYGSWFGSSPLAYILLFPVNIWVLEVIVGYLIIFLWGYNVAWEYSDYSDSYISGCIRIGHGVWWLGLGGICYIVYPVLQQLTAGL